MSVNVLRRPIHPEPGNASMAMAARAALLYSYGNTNGAPWTVNYGAKTLIQGEPLQIPWKTRAESDPNKPSPTGGANPQKPKPGIGIEEGDQSLEGGTEGDDISLTSETGQQMKNGDTLDEDTPLELSMTVYEFDPRVASKEQGAKNGHPVDVGEVLRKFDHDRKHGGGTEIAFRNLFAGPCSTFRLSVDDEVAHVKAQVFSPAEIEKKWEVLPGVKG